VVRWHIYSWGQGILYSALKLGMGVVWWVAIHYFARNCLFIIHFGALILSQSTRMANDLVSRGV
jgi:hypothetical protein